MHRPIYMRVGACSVIILAMGIPSWAEDNLQTMEQEVRAVEQRWLAAEDDPEVVKSILADDFVHVLETGFISKEDQLEYLRKHTDSWHGSRCFEELSVRIYGQIAIATGIVNAVRSGDGKQRRTAFTDVFVRRTGKWLAVNAQEISALPGFNNSRPGSGSCLKGST
jgi:ketosteroid isomerase-like protein